MIFWIIIGLMLCNMWTVRNEITDWCLIVAIAIELWHLLDKKTK